MSMGMIMRNKLNIYICINDSNTTQWTLVCKALNTYFYLILKLRLILADFCYYV